MVDGVQRWQQMADRMGGLNPPSMSPYQSAPMNSEMENMIASQLGLNPAVNVPYSLDPMSDSVILRQPATTEVLGGGGGGQAMSQKSFENQRKFQSKEDKKNLSTRDKMLQQINDYMSKREQITMDTENRLAKLDSQQSAKGPNLSALMAFGDSMAQGSVMGGGPTLANTYQASGLAPLTDTQLEQMRLKLGGVASNQYSGLTKDSMNMLRQEDMVNQWDNNRILKSKLNALKGNKSKPLSDATKKSLGNFQGAVAALDGILARVEMGERVRTGFEQTLSPSTELEKYLARFVEFFGREQSGAAISEKEWTSFRKLAVDWKDGKSFNIKKIKEMLNILKDRHDKVLSGEYVPFKSFDDRSSGPQSYSGQNSLPFSTMSDEDIKQAYLLKKQKEGGL